MRVREAVTRPHVVTGGVRNPLTAALVAMALHGIVGVALRWPFPSVAVLLAGLLAVAVANRQMPAQALGGLLALGAGLPMLLPPPVLGSIVAAAGTAGLPAKASPLANVAFALPALTVLLLTLTL